MGKRCFFIGIVVAFAFLFSISSFASTVNTKENLIVENSVTLTNSDDDWWERGVQYGRLLVLKNQAHDGNGTILATHCELNAGLEDYNPRYPIYRSTDDGKTFEVISYVTDTLTGANSEWNPHLFELEKTCGDYPAGTIILAACSIDAEHSKESYIRLYFSKDGGVTFEQGVIVAIAGGLEDGVWEPFLLQLDDGRLVCYYSDDSDPDHAQKIVYKISSDAEIWSDSVDVVATDIFAERPGMPVVTRLGDGSYFMVYEVVDKDGVGGNPVYCRRSTDALNWGAPEFIGEEIINYNGTKALGSAPFCGWTPVGGENGTLVVSGTFMRMGESDAGSDLFISNDNGETWVTVPHVIPYTEADHVGYSNSFTFSADGKYMYAINNPQNPQNTEKSSMVFAKVNFEDSMSRIDIDKMKSSNITLICGIISIVAGVSAVVCSIFMIRKRKVKELTV